MSALIGSSICLFTFALLLLASSAIHSVIADLNCEFVADAQVGIKNCSKPGLFALTFDDGPALQGGTEEVLDVLREKGIKATFFVTGTGWDTTNIDQEKKKQDLIRRIYAEGHQIGSHTWTHPNLILNRSREDIKSELTHIAQAVHDILGVKMTVFRPPYGCSNETVADEVENLFGYKVIMWNLNSKDWYFKQNTEASFSEYLFHMEPHHNVRVSNISSYIALHHDPAPGSAELARKVIDYINSKGFKFVTVGECIGVPNFL